MSLPTSLAGKRRKSKLKARILPFHLPQFHRTPENDEWWGDGFTEWTNVRKAKPLFKGHVQPKNPAELGYYDLTDPEAREKQAVLARQYGIEGFCYYHYWFGNGRRVLNRPVDEILASGAPNFPFTLCWANETWKGLWFGANRTLIEQTYPGRDDIERHFDFLQRCFEDPRYVTVDGKPLFQILTPSDIPDALEYTDSLREIAHRRGFKGIYLVAGYRHAEGIDPRTMGFDASVSSRFRTELREEKVLSGRWLVNRLLETRLLSDSGALQKPLKRNYRVFDYGQVSSRLTPRERFDWAHFPCPMPNWDNTPRMGVKGYVLDNATPEQFARQLRDAVKYVEPYPAEERLMFVKSWNEWAEGNYLEPDTDHGHGFLRAILDSVSD